MKFSKSSNNKSDRLNWKKFRQEQSRLIETSGLPLDYLENENLWIDFLMHGYIDHHPDSIRFTVDDMNELEYDHFKRLIDAYFSYGFEFFTPMALSSLNEQGILREKYENK